MAPTATYPSPKAAPRKRAATAKASTRSAPSSAERASRQTTTAKRNATVASRSRSRAARATVTEAKSGAALVGTQAQRAVLVPIGAALAARDRVVDLISELLDTYSTRKKTEAQLERFERRGISARDRVERETRTARAKVRKTVKSIA